MVSRKYKALIERFPLVPIKSDEHLNAAHEMAQSLMLRSEGLSEDESDYLEVLLNQIGNYEFKLHPLNVSDLAPHELLQSFMEEHKMKQVEVQKILGVSSGVISELVSGKRELTKKHCVKLGQYFKVSPALFLPKVSAA
jgi:HTH-type transcriptional regulator / antitoxin HigA